ncbi:TRAP transporter small permease [Inquilinus limosus]|uniref:TRAP transporter small permease n=1 Tax=Inquilinus limosus TaxID=171674 RepID=UPI003F150653
MASALTLMRRILGVLSTGALWLAGVGMLAMTVTVGWQVFARYVLNDTPSWAEPLTLQLMGWFILLGAAVGVRESFHLGLDLLQHTLPPALARVLEVVNLLLILGFGGAMVWYSVQLAIGTWTATIPVLDLPGGFDFIPLVVGGALIALFAAERLVEQVAGLEHEAAVEGVRELA